MRISSIITAFLSLSAIHCSKSADAPKYPDASAFCTGWAQAECSDTVVQNCAASTKDVCLSKRTTYCEEQVVKPAQDAGFAYDYRQAEGCVSQIGTAYSDAKVTSAEALAIAEKCGLVFSGSGTENSACDVDADCKQGDGLRCVAHAAPSELDAGSSAAGTCQVPQVVQAGQSCSATDAKCTSGYHCGSSSHCDADGKVTEACSAAAPCESTLKCSTSNTCVAKLADGAVCKGPSDCTGGMCLEGNSSSLCASVEILSPNEPFCTPLHP